MHLHLQQMNIKQNEGDSWGGGGGGQLQTV